MWATAEKVVPRSIPTALRWFIFGEVIGADSPAPVQVQLSCRAALGIVERFSGAPAEPVK